VASVLQEATLNVATPEIDSRIDAQKRNLDALLQRYTEQHPDIVTTRRLIKELQDQKTKEMAELRKAALAQAVATGPTIGAGASVAQQELARMLAASEVQVAALKARVGEYSTRLAQARATMKNAPQIEAEAAQLNRDYGIVKKNYEDLVARRQSAVMSGELEVASGVADFRLIDPPRVTPKPVAPNRLLLLPLPLIGGLMLGALLTLAASQLRPVFMDAADLRSKTGLPILGVISIVLDEAERRRERLSQYRFVGAISVLICAFVIGLATMGVMNYGS
jgi:polysaccharide chain length determinant protein (PEP-CTERM system associated)